jgi:hypothetical protein
MSLPTRSRGRLAAAALLLAGLAPRAGAQPPAPPDSARRDSVRVDSARAAGDSLAERLARAEAAIALLRRQLGEVAEGGARARSRARLEFRATLLTNAFHTSRRVNVADVPLFALPPADARPPRGVLGASLRQSRVGAAATIDDVLGATLDAVVDVDFFGGTSGGPADRRLFPEPRLRVANARLAWARTELLVGSETPLVSDLDPISAAAVGIPDFTAAGNLWNWLPQVRVTRDVGPARGAVRWAVQGAVLAPVLGASFPGEPDAADAAERARRPFLQARVRARWGGDPVERDLPPLGDVIGRGGEIGVGAHRGWADVGGGAIRASRALTADARVALARTVELRGEAYAYGRLLRGLGGGAIGQVFGRPAPGAPAGTVGAPLRDAAAWGQLNWRAHPTLVAGAGCGVNAVRPEDLPVRRRNAACAAHAQWRPVQPLLVGLEWRRLRTRYDAATYRASHLNLALGVEL